MSRPTEEQDGDVASCARCGLPVLRAFAATVVVPGPDGERVYHFHETCLVLDDRSEPPGAS